MPSKSRHGKGKHYHHSKKSRAWQHNDAIAPLQHEVTGAPQLAATIGTSSSSRAPASPATSRVAQYPYVTTELRNIAILTGIILVILIVLALVLS